MKILYTFSENQKRLLGVFPATTSLKRFPATAGLNRLCSIPWVNSHTDKLNFKKKFSMQIANYVFFDRNCCSQGSN